MHDTGVGLTPLEELPDRATMYTPEQLDEVRAPTRAALLKLLEPRLQQSYAITGLCTDPNAVVHIDIPRDDWKYLFRKQYRIPLALIPLTDQCLERWYKTWRIEGHSESNGINNPLLVVPRRDAQGTLTAIRVCLDPRLVNKYQTNTDHYQLPRIEDELAMMRKPYFGEADLSEAYMQMPVAEESRKFLSFTWGRPLRFRSCPYGLTHIPSFFQRFMTNLFLDMPFVRMYIDNLVFCSDTWEEHLRQAEMIIDRLLSANLRIKPGSFNFGHARLRMLGHIVSAQAISIDPKKQADVARWELPFDHANLRSFLGFTGFLRDHIRHYADIAAPLDEIKARSGPIVWTPLLREHFATLKQAVATVPWLVHFDSTKPTAVATDASAWAVGAVLYQPSDAALTLTPYNIVAICSKKLTEAQRRYSAYKKELWAVVYSLLRFHHYLHCRRFSLVTDHLPLGYMFDQENLSTALQQWLDVIMAYRFTIYHRPGALHLVPDAVSRMYSSMYTESKAAWGSMSHIKFAEYTARHATPADLVVSESIEADKTKMAARRVARTTPVKRPRSSVQRLSASSRPPSAAPSAPSSSSAADSPVALSPSSAPSFAPLNPDDLYDQEEAALTDAQAAAVFFVDIDSEEQFTLMLSDDDWL